MIYTSDSYKETENAKTKPYCSPEQMNRGSLNHARLLQDSSQFYAYPYLDNLCDHRKMSQIQPASIVEIVHIIVENI